VYQSNLGFVAPGSTPAWGSHMSEEVSTERREEQRRWAVGIGQGNWKNRGRQTKEAVDPAQPRFFLFMHTLFRHQLR
jgi:hypothetical protein